MYLQQGDVLLKIIDVIPSNVKEIKPEERGFVLAEGEFSGHYHAVKETDNGIRMFMDTGGGLYLEVTKSKELLHQEHGVVDLFGKYEVDYVKKYNYFEKKAERVSD